MTLFETLLLSHLIGDWMMQTEYMAMNKARGSFFNQALITHCCVYMLVFLPALSWTQSSLFWLLLIYASHMIIDRRWPVVWWIRTFMRTSTQTISALPWLVIVVDQVMHIAILALIASVSS